MASLLSALAPKAEFSFADVVEEVRRLRDENELLKAQVEMLSQNRLNPGSAAAAPAAADASSNGSTALAGTDGDGSAAGAFQSLRKELAVNLGADPAEASSSQVKALQQQLVASREQLSWLQIARGVDALAIAAELHEAEGALLWLRRERAAQQAVCEELEAAVQQQASLARQAQQVAVAESRQQMAASHAALEEQCMALQEELDRRQALQEQFGVEEELEEGARQAAAWEARCRVKEQEVARLRDDIEAAHRQFEPQLRRQRARADEAEAALQAERKDRQAAAAVQKHMEAQVVRLSEAFNRQVEERDEAQAALEASERRRRQMVEKEVARSWVVNFLENKDRRPEFLELMANWWEFSEEDLMRCGMAEELPPQPDLSPDATLTEAFAHFLEREEATAPAPLSPTSPGARVAQIRAPESPRTPGAAGQRTSLWTG